MNIENFIECKYRELIASGSIHQEFVDLYAKIENQKLKHIFANLHYNYISLFTTMNKRLPTNENGAHFWGEHSRKLINNIDITIDLYNELKNTEYAFEIDDYYFRLIKKCRDFLRSSGGSLIPAHMPKIDLYYTLPIFKPASTISVKNKSKEFTFPLKLIGSGSYADVYKYTDTFYNKTFALKRAKKGLSEK